MRERLDHLIVVVPGIGGSVLADDRGRPVWGDARRRVAQVLVDPGRLSLNESPRLLPVALMPSAGHVPPLRLHGYDRLVRGLRNGLDVRTVKVDVATPSVPGYERDLNADVVLMPYDFRHGIRPAAEQVSTEVRLRLQHLSERDRTRRVVVIGHSMGGLVARYWAACLPEQGRLCRAVLTVGTPHRGAPKALDWLVNGAAVGAGPVGAATSVLLKGMTDLLREWPAMYELLPTYEVIRVQAGTTIRPVGLQGLITRGFAATEGFAHQVHEAATVHEEITRAWECMAPEVRPPVVPFLARDHGTAHAAFLTDGALRVTDEDPGWQPNPGWRGDGTVPALSAVPSELWDLPELQHPVRERHTPMASCGEVVQVARALTGDRAPVRGEKIEGPRLGVDIDDAVVVCEPTTVRARLAGDDGQSDGGRVEGDGIAMWMSVGPADGSAPAQRQRMERSGDGWVASLTSSVPGVWEVTVQAVGVPGRDTLTVTDTIGVVDLGGLDGGPGTVGSLRAAKAL